MLARQLTWAVITGVICAALLPAQIQLQDVTVLAGGSAVLPVSLQAAAAPISGIQFDLEYDRTALKVEVTVGDAVRSSAKQLYVVDVEQRQRVIIVGLNTDRVVEGTLAYLQVSASPTATSNLYSLRVVNLVAASPAADEIPFTSSDAVIQVNSRPDESPSDVRALNAASFIAGPVAPGEIITAMGAGLATDADRSDVVCLINGISAPLLHLDINRFSAIVPDSLTPNSVVTLQLQRGTQTLASTTLAVTRTAPGIFTNPSTGVGQAVATHEDGSLNSASNPVERGSFLKLFVTGTGINTAVSARTGTTNWEVVSAAAGIDIPGVTSVVARVPLDLEPGTAIGIIVEADGRSSQDGVTVAVR